VSLQIHLMGPRPGANLPRVVGDLDPEAMVAMVTAGWQEREGDDAELRELAGHRTTNLALNARCLAVYEEDREYAHAEREHEAALAELRQLYSCSSTMHSVRRTRSPDVPMRDPGCASER